MRHQSVRYALSRTPHGVALVPDRDATSSPVTHVRAVLATLKLHAHTFRDREGGPVSGPAAHQGGSRYKPKCVQCGSVSVGLWCETVTVIQRELTG